MPKAHTIRLATSADVEPAVSLIGMTVESLSHGLFPSGHLRAIIADLFVHRGNRFSHQFAAVAETGGGVIGLLLSYPGKAVSRLGLSTGYRLLRALGAIPFVRFALRALPLACAAEANSDKYFVSSLAVFPEWWGHRVATTLLSHAEMKARRLALVKCALTVELHNLRARHLFECLGYRIAQTINLSRTVGIHGSAGYHRMVKAL
jgi:GNAT superfamily N-acetyltransferase